MADTFWHKQTKDEPLFPDLLWSRPENQLHAGKLLIIGGSGYEFKAPANAYGDSLEAGIGSAKVLLPDSMRKTVENIFPEAEFAPSTISGSFATKSLAEFLNLSSWADGVLLAGDFGKNSETAILLENFANKYTGQLTLVGDSLDHFMTSPNNLLSRTGTTVLLSFVQLQQLLIKTASKTALTSKTGLLQLVEILHDLSKKANANLITALEEYVIVASGGQISTTKQSQSPTLASVAASTSVWWLQNQTKTFEALTTALVA